MHVAQTFHPDFYVTCATVIPVLFLAVAVQGTSYQDLLDTLVKAARAPVNSPPLLQLRAYAAALLTALVAVVVGGLGSLGEIEALYTLYLGREAGDRGLVLAATLGLLLATAAGPLWRGFRATIMSTDWAPAVPRKDEQSASDDEHADSHDDGTDVLGAGPHA